MSKLVICKACGKEVVKGTKCPNCGHDQRNFFMKHKIITVILVIFIIGCFSSAMRGNKETITPSIVADSAMNSNKGTTVTQPITQPAKSTENLPKPTPTPSQNVEQTVYTTNSGSKYHKAGCRYLSKSEIPITKTEAINEGLTPCSVCNP